MVKTCILIYISFLIVNVGKYTIHGCYGIGKVVAFLIQDIFQMNKELGRLFFLVQEPGSSKGTSSRPISGPCPK